MNKIYTSLIVVINIFLFYEPVFAYKNFDECGKLKSLIKKNINKLSLEENYETTKKLFGFSVDKNYTITKVHSFNRIFMIHFYDTFNIENNSN